MSVLARQVLWALLVAVGFCPDQCLTHRWRGQDRLPRISLMVARVLVAHWVSSDLNGIVSADGAWAAL